MYIQIYIRVFVLAASNQFTNAIDQDIEEEEIRAQAFLDRIGDELVQRRNLDAIVNWEYASNITDHNEKRKNEVAADNAKYAKVSDNTH